MKTLYEPTEENINKAVVNPGTHYFVAEPWCLSRVRQNIYDAVKRGGQFNIHTSYNRKERTLRVVISD